MNNRTKLILSLLMVSILIAAMVVPTFALAYPDPSGELGRSYWQPLNNVYVSDSTDSLSILIDNYWGNYEADTLLTVTTSNGFEKTLSTIITGSSTKKIQISPIGADSSFPSSSTLLYYKDFVVRDFSYVNTALNQPNVMNDTYLLLRNLSDDADVFLTVDFDFTYYERISDGEGGYEWRLITEHYTNSVSRSPSTTSYGDSLALHGVVNNMLRDACNKYECAVPLGLTYLPYSVSGLTISVPAIMGGSADNSYFNGIVTTARSSFGSNGSRFDYGKLSLDYIPDGSGGYENGYAEGYEDGYIDGENEGYAVGKDEGYDIGFDEGENFGFNLGYDTAINWEKQTWIDEGYADGYSKGEADGYMKGLTDGSEVPNDVGEFLSDSIGSFLDVELFGDITLGSILLIVITIPLCIFFLKLFAGG